MNQVTQAQFGMIPLHFIETDPEQPRRTFNQAALEELAASVKESGVLQPILLRTLPDSDTRLQLVAGERRYRAATIAGLSEIPGIVRQLTDAQVATIQLVENHQREGVHPMEEADAIDRAMKRHGFSVDQVCTELGVTKAWVYSRLKLLDLVEGARPPLLEGKVSASTALLVARIPVPSLQVRAMEEIAVGDGGGAPMSHRDAKEMLEARYMLRLARASFDTTDTKLVKGCTSCIACPKRTGNQPDLYSDIDADVCTDPDCFALKGKATEEAMIAKAKKKNLPIFEDQDEFYESEACENLVSGTDYAHEFDRVSSAQHYYRQIDMALPKEDRPEPAGLMMDHEGRPQPLYRREDVQLALEKKGVALTKDQQEEADKLAEKGPEKVAAAKKASAEELLRKHRELVAQNAENYRTELLNLAATAAMKSNDVLQFLRLIARLLVTDYSPSDALRKTLCLPDDDDELREMIGRYEQGSLLCLILDFCTAGMRDVSPWSMDLKTFELHDADDVELVEQYAIFAGVDVAKIRADHPTPLYQEEVTVSAKKAPKAPKTKPAVVAPAEVATSSETIHSPNVGGAVPSPVEQAEQDSHPGKKPTKAKKTVPNPAAAWPFPKGGNA